MVVLLMTLAMMTGCQTTHRPLPTADHVDLECFMGLWYVLGYTPILVDKDAYNAIEHYALDDRGRIQTTYQFRKGNFEGDLKTYNPVGKVHNTETNAEWRMQFIWPFQAQYFVFYLSEDYQATVVAHPNRKYAWIMHRKPEMHEDLYDQLIAKLEREGFNPASIHRVPHDWSGDADRLKRFGGGTSTALPRN